jgi:hypothetical protein
MGSNAVAGAHRGAQAPATATGMAAPEPSSAAPVRNAREE